MKEGGLLLDLPAARAVRWVALRRLEEARAAHERLGTADALHDFRVAIRRLRSTLDAYRGEVRRLSRGRDRRALRAVARATGDARDAEVELAWLGSVRARGAERDGVDWSRQRAQSRAAAAVQKVNTAAESFPKLARRLRRRLESYRCEVRLEDPRETPLFRELLSRQLTAGADALQSALAAVTDVTRQEEAHQARIAAKQLRYLLEPAADAVPGGRDALRGLRALQDGLGAMRDRDVMWRGARTSMEQADGAPAAGAQALLARLGRERGSRFAQVRRGWLGEAARPLLERVRGVAAELAAPPADREVERKYLLRAMPRLRGLQRSVHRLDQGYLPGKRLVERVRRERGPDGVRHFRTVKVGSGVSRIELEEPCDEQVFAALWRLTRGRRVRKLRYRVPVGDLVWEIDRFQGRPLVLAEVELPDEHAAVTIPEWLAPVLEREVTGEAAYLNLNLAG